MISTVLHLLLVLLSLLLAAGKPGLFTGLLLLLSLITAVWDLTVRRRERGRRLAAEVMPLHSRVAELEQNLSETERERTELKVRLEATQDERRKQNEILRRIGATLQLFDRTLPILGALTTRVVERTEQSNVELSDAIFSIVEQSKQLGNEIQGVLRNLIEGDDGLERNIGEIESEVERFKRLITALEGISANYLADMAGLKETVGNIGSFTARLTDLADQTSLLSINASIEAARAGSAGSGFRVIAAEVQSLARRSKTIAEEINTHIRAAAETVEHSFNKQESTIGESIRQIGQSRESLAGLATSLRPQLERISTTVEESRRISGGVTEDLNGIIVSLQYHDIIRQILDHSMSILGEIKSRCLDETLDGIETELLSVDELEGAVRDLAGKYFTVDDEWDILGIAVRDTGGLEEREELKRQYKLEGDITLF